MRALAWLVASLATFCLATPIARAAGCGCDLTIPINNAQAGDQTTSLSAILPGQTVCFTSGLRTRVQNLTNVNGTSGHSIIIKNCGGLVDVNTSAGVAMQISGAYFHFTGTGDTGTPNGFRLKSTVTGDNSMQVVGRITDIEIDHVEINGAPYAGIMAKIDMGSECQPELARPTANFVMQNISLHDLDIHDTVKGEGIYLGDSFYNGSDVYNSGSTACPKGHLQYPIPIRHVRVYNVHVHSSGREAIQVGGADQDVEIHHNQVELYGQDNFDNSQNNGIQMGVGTTGRLYDNIINGGVGEAIVVQGIGEDYVYNNIIVGNGHVAMSVNTRPTPLATDPVPNGFLGGVYFIDNTIIDSGAKGALIQYVNTAPNNVFFNNLIVTSLAGTSWNMLGTTTNWTLSNTVVAATTDAAKFVNAGGGDYHLAAGSPAIGAGKDVSSYGVLADYDNLTRASAGAVGAYEYVAPNADLAKPVDLLPPDDLAPYPMPDFATTPDLTTADDLFGADLLADLASPDDSPINVLLDADELRDTLPAAPIDLSTYDATPDIHDYVPNGTKSGCHCNVAAAPSADEALLNLFLLFLLWRYGVKTKVVTLRAGIE